MTLRQVHLGDEHLVPQAIIELPVSKVVRDDAFELERGNDDLDFYEGFDFELLGRVRFALRHYRGHPPTKTTLYLPAHFRHVDEITRLIAEIVRELGIPARLISWQRKDDPDL